MPKLAELANIAQSLAGTDVMYIEQNISGTVIGENVTLQQLTAFFAVSGAGETNTASNVGASGVGVFHQKDGVDLEFNKLLAGTGMSVNLASNIITIATTGVLADLAGITPATGDLYYYDGANLVALVAGTNGNVIKQAAGIPSWAALAIADVANLQTILDAKAASSHNHAASDINSGTLAHERGGLEADVSAYSGLVKITGGATSAVAVTSFAESILDDADAGTARTTLGAAASADVTAADAKASRGGPLSIITESTTSRTLALTDIGDYIRLTNSSSCTITIPANATVAWASETYPPVIYFRVAAAGIPTLSHSITVNDPKGVIAALETGDTFALQWVASDVWDVI